MLHPQYAKRNLQNKKMSVRTKNLKAPLGFFLFADKIKKDALETIKGLKEVGVKQTVMLTGDKKEVGEYVAKELGIDKVYTELLPKRLKIY